MIRKVLCKVPGCLDVLLLPGQGRGADRSASSAATALHGTRPGQPNLSAEGAVGGVAPWFGPQTALDGRPPALMDAGAKGR